MFAELDSTTQKAAIFVGMSCLFVILMIHNKETNVSDFSVETYNQMLCKCTTLYYRI
jgi:succinate-acetate transporter protein